MNFSGFGEFGELPRYVTVGTVTGTSLHSARLLAGHPRPIIGIVGSICLLRLF